MISKYWPQKKTATETVRLFCLMILPKIVTVTSRGRRSNSALPVTVAISLQQCHRQWLLAAVSTATTETVGLTGNGNDRSCERTSVVALVIAITFQHCKNGKTEVNSNC